MHILSHNTIKHIAEKFGTPTYLYFINTLEKQRAKIQDGLTKYCEIYYSMKANPLLSICQYFAAKKLGCEVCSKNELLTAIKSGFPKNKIIFAGPGKTDQDLTLCVTNNIKAIICESIEEMIRVDKIAKIVKRVMPVMVRLNPEFHITKAPIKMSGVASQFGIDVSQFEANYRQIKSCHHIRLIGMQVYNGSRILDYQAVLENIQHILKLADHLSSVYSIHWENIDVGGGLGVRYFSGESDFDAIQFVPELNTLLNNYYRKHQKTRFILELGRFLVAESGVLISKVISTKTNHGKNYAIVDAGMHCLFSATGLNSFVQRNFLAEHIPVKTTIFSNQKIVYQVTGPLCTPGDVLLRDICFSKISPGDFILFYNVGAYGYTASPNRFLSHDMPAEVIAYQDKLFLARKKESIQQILQTQMDLGKIYC